MIMNLPIGQLINWGPMTILSIAGFLTWMVYYFLELWWPFETIGGKIIVTIFTILASSSTYWFITASFAGPGFVPNDWKPVNQADTEHLPFCTVCKVYKAPRSLHCKLCGRCVLKMDHHCPWINICVGHNNHVYFLYFLTCVLMFGFQAVIVLSICLYHAINYSWYIHHGTGLEPMIKLSSSSLMLTMFATGLSVGVVVATVYLLYGQVIGFLKNCTDIETWVVRNAKRRRAEHGLPPFVFPYDLGWKKNLKLLFDFRFNGLHWPLRPGCHVRDIIEEQKAQKLDRERRFFVCRVSQEYSGGWFPAGRFRRAALAPPLSAELRLSLRVGESVRVFSQTKEWMFGAKLAGDRPVEAGRRGWFPRAAVVRCDDTSAGHTDAHTVATMNKEKSA